MAQTYRKIIQIIKNRFIDSFYVSLDHSHSGSFIEARFIPSSVIRFSKVTIMLLKTNKGCANLKLSFQRRNKIKTQKRQKIIKVKIYFFSVKRVFLFFVH